MNNLLKVLAGALLGSTLAVGGTTVFGANDVPVEQQIAEAVATATADADSDKVAMAKYYVEAQVRLNEPVTQDPSIISNEELSGVLAAIANEKGLVNPAEPTDLLIVLHDKAVEEGVACVK